MKPSDNYICQQIIKKQLEQRAIMIRAIRNFFYHNGYLEVETPIRIPTPIPEQNIESFQAEEWYLQSSPEICMKRLAARGYGKIFQICKCFRKDERGDHHLNELTMLEWYRKGYSYIELMDECKDMIRYIFDKVYINYGNYHISLNKQWQQITVSQAFEKYGRMNMEEAEEKGYFDEIMAFEIEPNLGLEVPTFIYDYPASRAALAKLKNNLAERFELYIGGIELANGFSELTDPVEQRERFVKEIQNREIDVNININKNNKTGKSVGSNRLAIPEKFIEELPNMPPTAGIALGVDRLAMIFTNSSTIDQVVTFTPEEL